MLEPLVRCVSRQLEETRFLRAKCRTLKSCLDEVEVELDRLVSNGLGLETEAALHTLKDAVESITQRNKSDPLSIVASFLLARSRLEEIDECHMRLVELLEQARLHGDLKRLEDRMRIVQGQLQKQFEEDCAKDVTEDHAVLLAALESETEGGAGEGDALELLAHGRDMDAEEFVKALKTGGTIRSMAFRIAKHVQDKDRLLEANISEEELETEPDILGTGSFGDVFKGKLLGESVTVKFFSSGQSHAEGLTVQDRQSRELKRWKGLEHENVVHLLGTCVRDSVMLLVMERCDMSLSDFLYQTSEPVSLETFEALARGILRGLGFLHQNMCVHQNVNPDSIFLSYDLGRVKLSNVGLSSFMERSLILYDAPEVLGTHARWTSRSDLFSFALVCWEILHRETPWEKGTRRTVLLGKLERGERPAFSEDVALKGWHVKLITRCWDHRPSARPSAETALKLFEKKAPLRRSTKILKSMLSVLLKRGRTPRRSQTQESRVPLEEIDRTNKTLVEEEEEEEEENAGDDEAVVQEANPSIDNEQYQAEEDGKERDDDDEIDENEQDVDGNEGNEEQEQGQEGFCVDVLEGQASESDVQRAIAAMENPATFGEGLRLMLVLLRSDHITHKKDSKEVLSLRMAAWELGCPALLLNFLASMETLDTDQVCDSLLALAFMMQTEEGKEYAHVAERDYHVVSMVMKALQVFTDDAGIQATALRVLAKLCISAKNQASLLETGVVDQTLAAMAKHMGDAKVQCFGCGTLWNLAVRAENRPTLMEKGAGEAVLAAMQAHASHVGVQCGGIGALGKLGENNEDNQNSLRSMGAIEGIVDAMQHHCRNADVQVQGAMALTILSFDNLESQQALVNAGAVDALLLAMTNHKQNAKVQEIAMLSLQVIAKSKRDFLQEVNMADVEGVVLLAMQSHPQVAKVQETATRLVGVLFDRLDHVSIAEDFTSAVLLAMSSHPLNAKLQQFAIGTLCRGLAKGTLSEAALVEKRAWVPTWDAMKSHPSNAVIQKLAGKLLDILLKESGLVDEDANIFLQAVIQAMQENAFQAVLQFYACGVLWHLVCENKNNHLGFLERNGVQVILAAIKHHSSDANVQQQASKVLWGLSREADNVEALQREGALDAMLIAMRNCPMDALVQVYGISAYVNLAPCEGSSWDEIEAAEVVLQAMKNHPRHVTIQHLACKVLRGLVISEENHGTIAEKLLEMGAAESVLNAMRKNASEARIQRDGSEVLRFLAPAGLATLLELGAPETVLQAMINHPSKHELQQACCATLWNLTAFSTDENRLDLVNKGAVDLVLLAMLNHPSKAGVHAYGFGALGSILHRGVGPMIQARIDVANAIIVGMCDHESNAIVQKEGCVALGNISVKDSSFLDSLMEIGVADAVLDAMRNHSSNAEVQSSACFALLKLTMLRENVPKLISLGTLELAREAKQSHPDSKSVQKFADSLVKNLQKRSTL